MNKLIVVVLIFILIPIAFSYAQSPIIEDLLAQIKQLQEQINLLQTQVEQLQTRLSSTESELVEVKIELGFTKTLRRGVTGEEVRKLQEFLKQFSDIYPEGLVTGYFGPLTEKAVRKFQEKEGVVNSGSPATTGFGQVGPKTRTKLNELLSNGAGASGVTPPGLLIAPGVQKKLATTTSIDATSVPSTTTPSTTPSGTIPAVPAIPAPPSSGGGGGGSATPATPAVPSTPDPEPTPTEDTEALCSDEIDNDGDSLIDLDDPDCSAYVPDTTPPVISNVQATSITDSSAIITWTTDEDSDSKVDYALVSGFPNSTTTSINSLSNVTNHSINLSNLLSDITHYFIVISSDESGNTATSSEQSFTTLPPPTQCNDGIDNDSDGLTDLSDPGCTDASDNDETNIVSTDNTHSMDFEQDSQQYLSITDADQTGLDLGSGENKTLTIEWWAKLESTVPEEPMVVVDKYAGSNNNQYIVHMFTDGYINFTAYPFGIDGGGDGREINSPITIGVWEHWAVTYDAQAIQTEVFKNGVSQGNGTISAASSILGDSIYDGTADFIIAAHLEGSNNHVDGKLDEVRIWNYVRTDSEIANNYTKELTGSESGLVGYWQFDNELTGGKVKDETANGNHLDLNNGPIFSTDTPF